jgi:hypothetical protein
MEHVLVDLAPGRQGGMPAAAAARPDGGRAGRRGSDSWRQASAGRPVRHRQEAARLRADMREFQAALARWAR